MVEKEEEEEENVKIPLDVCALAILPHLSAKNLQILKTVCKDWLKLINSPYFVNLHLSNRSRIRILAATPYHIDDHTNYNNYRKSAAAARIPYPPQFSGNFVQIAGSADGLLCLLDPCLSKNYVAAIINPSTGKYLVEQGWLPRRNGAAAIIRFWWFGNFPSEKKDGSILGTVGEYVLVLGMWYETMLRMEIGVYKFTTTYIECFHSFLIDDMEYHMHYCDETQRRGTLVNGVVHWPFKPDRQVCHYKILAYRIDKNTYSEIPPPVQCDFKLGAVGGCLLATVNSERKGVFELWIMREESWAKYCDIGGFNNFRVLSPVGFFPDGDMVLCADYWKLIKYNFNNNTVVLLMHYYNCLKLDTIMCADSLVSPQILEG